MIDLFPESEAARETWQALIDLTRRRPIGWTLIGAQMVALHGLERGRLLPRLTADADLLVDVRLVTNGIREMSSELVGAGFELSDPDLHGVAHRFRRGKAILDVLAPDGLSERSDLTTVPPCHTIPCPGGSQALKRSEPVEVRLGPETAAIPRPSVLGAVLVKARAVSVSDRPEDQRRDLAFLLTLLNDPHSAADELRGRERSWLRRRVELRDPEHPAWAGLEAAEDGLLALDTLLRASR